MKNTTTQPNAYTITWAVITPLKGKFIKKNLNELSKKIFSITKYKMANEAICHFSSKEQAIEKLSNVSASKQFKVTLITDKQFGMTKWNEPLLANATQKQIEESFIIGNKS